MFEIPVEDLVFVVCTLVGGGLLLITVLVDDILGGVLDALNIGFDIGGVSLMPLALAFVSMFGVGGLFATQVLDVHGGPAADRRARSFGAAGFGVAYLLFSVMRRSEGADAVLDGRPWSDARRSSPSASRPATTAASSSRPRARRTSSARPRRRTSRPGRPSASPAPPAPASSWP